MPGVEAETGSMRKFFAALMLSCGLLFSGFSAPTQAQDDLNIEAMTSDQIAERAESLQPAVLYVLAARLLSEGRGQEAANWMYAGQLRYRFLLAAMGEAASDERVLFSALSEQVGRPVNEHIAGDPDEWIAAMTWALEWDEETANDITSKTAHAAELAEVRDGLAQLIEKVDSSRAEIRRHRSEAGLENR